MDYFDVFPYVTVLLWGYYSVMQSDENSFCGDVVSDSFKMVSSDEDLKYEKQILSDLYYEDLKF